MANTRGPLNSSQPSNGIVVSGVYNAVAPAPADEQPCALQVDDEGNLLVNVIAGTIIATEASVGLNGAPAPASSTQVGGTNGTDLEPLQVDSSGNLKVNVNVSLPAGTNTIGKVEVLGNAGGAFDSATQATPPANAVQIGAVASTTLPTSTTAGDIVAPMADIAGRLIVRSAGPRERLITNGITITSSTAPTSLIAAGSANIFRDLTFLQASNSSATGCLLTISDGTKSYVWYLAPSGGGFNINFDPPLAASSAATAWTATCGSSVASIYVSAQADESK
jgi:hypothetical protein